MVLKLQTETGWRFIGGITDVECAPSTTDIFLQSRDYTLLHHNVREVSAKEGILVDGLRELSPKDQNCGWPIKEITANFCVGEVPQTIVYLVDGQAYLMSDEGKTIERIN